MNADKATIRAAALQRRDAIPPDARHANAQRIVARICALEVFMQAQTVLAYSGFGTEIDTTSLLEQVRKSGKTLVLPRISRVSGMLELFRVDDPAADLTAGVWGIKEPDAERCMRCMPQELDLIVMPGVAFDRRGGRLGYGKGYYDRLLGECIGKGLEPVTVAGAFEAQVIDTVPMERHDVPVDVLVTEAGIFRRQAAETR
jgi:5-formyltetrahydrofolate cyclo-ligase